MMFMPGVTPKQVFSLPRPDFICSGLSTEALLEYEQAVIRVLFTSMVALYFLLHGMFDSDPGIFSTAFYLAGSYLVFSLGIVLSFAFHKRASVIRKSITMLGDHGMTCLAMYRADEAGAPLFTVILWITVGYGARYGTSYLYLGMLLSSLGLLLLVNTTGFWLEHPVVGYGMIVTNIVIPIFVSQLLKQLSDAKARAEAADEAKGRFLANMSHEMRTPLSGIIGISKLLYKESVPASVKSSIVTIDQSAKHLLQLIDDVLNFSRIESGNLHIDHEPYDVYEVIYNVSDNLRPVAQEKNLNFNVYISSDVPTSLVGDSNRLKQVLINLCGNAIKFTKRGYVEVRVNALAVDDDQTTLRFEIIDTGIGIPQDALPRIFERFNQVDDSITRQFGGSGLGTTISKEIVELMGGQIHVQSDFGKGSRFYFDLPIKLGETQEEVEFKGARCLIYTNNHALRTRLEGFTARWGLRVVATSNLHNICQLLVEHEQDSVLPILLVDGATLDGEFDDFVKYVKFGVSRDVEMVLLDTEQRWRSLEGKITTTVSDLSTPRQLFNALHGVNRKYELPSDVTDLSETKKAHFKRLNVLIAEDSRVNRMILEEVLRAHDVNVISAEDGDKALEIFEHSTFDLAIVDMQMPNVGGLDVIREYNAGYGLFKKIPFIVLTANVSIDARKECERAGAAAYLKKPVDEDELLQLIYKLTGKKEDTDTTHAPSSQSERKTLELERQAETLEMRVINNLMTISSKEGFFEELVTNYLQDLNKSLKIIENAIKDDDFQRYHNEAHAVKGVSANIGAKGVFQIAKLANDDNSSEFKESGQTRHDEFVKAMREVEIAFKELLEGDTVDLGTSG
jgi:two-component system sensor histidine kinase RpfC